jgi:hypothetical protein
MDEVDAFAMMVKLMNKYSLRDMFIQERTAEEELRGAGDGSRERVPGLLEVARIGRGYGEVPLLFNVSIP